MPDGQSFVSGGLGGALAAYDLAGKKLGNYLGHESDVWAVTASPDGRLLVSGSHDQTIRVWNARTFELIATLFSSLDGEWVIWTPQGHYAGSKASGNILGWHINNGSDKAADFVQADELKGQLYRPDIIRRAIVLASSAQAAREASGASLSLRELVVRQLRK